MSANNLQCNGPVTLNNTNYCTLQISIDARNPKSNLIQAVHYHTVKRPPDVLV